MYILRAGKVVPVLALPLLAQIALHEVNGHVEENIDIRPRLPEYSEFSSENPFAEPVGFGIIGKLCTLIGDIGIYIPVQQNGLARIKCLGNLRHCSVAVLREQQGHQLRMNGAVVPEIPAQKTRNQLSIDRSIVAREMYVFQSSVAGGEIFFEHTDLGGFACPVQSFQNYQHNAQRYLFFPIFVL